MLNLDTSVLISTQISGADQFLSTIFFNFDKILEKRIQLRSIYGPRSGGRQKLVKIDLRSNLRGLWQTAAGPAQILHLTLRSKLCTIMRELYKPRSGPRKIASIFDFALRRVIFVLALHFGAGAFKIARSGNFDAIQVNFVVYLPIGKFLRTRSGSRKNST